MLNFDGDRLSHAYIAEGLMADTIAQTAVCSKPNKSEPCGICAHCQKSKKKIHPDIIYISKLADKRDITIDQVRELKSDVIVIPNEAPRKTYIINDAHLMNINTQNAFLQILEEPPKHVVFVLKTAYPTQLLKTVLSRCVHVKSKQGIKLETETKISEGDCVVTDSVTRFYDSLAKGNLAIAEFMFELEKLDKEKFSEFISSAKSTAAKLLSNPNAKSDKMSMKTISEAEKLLVEASGFLDLNVSIGHISGYICANLIKS